ncbi:nucleoside phosphorylase [Candidatus Avelusimicrobium facis]|uniref:nucleoside phosphorylase n=1 Tax=Candidatus Avelusimicrobium facis TaxID=3416203 RepID=UPI0015B53ED7
MSLLFPKKRKAALKELSSAKNYLKHLHCNLNLPKKAIICPLSSMTAFAQSQAHFKKYNCEADIYADEKKGYCYVTGFGVGAPALAMALEVLIALGVKEFILMGLAGSLQPEALAADVVLCDGALADEGITAHYVPQERILPHAALTQKLDAALTQAGVDHHTGPTWTTDAIFRETAEEVAYYQKKNVLTVEMEASAFFAVCRQKKVKAAAAFVVSDELYRLKWEPHFGEKPIFQNLYKLYHAAVNALTGK